MKTQKIIYWVTTGLVSLGMVLSFFNYFMNPAMKAGYAHIGFPDWFRVELGIAKLLGAIALIVPAVPPRIKEWTYAGFFINFFSAIWAHHFAGDALGNVIAPVILLILLILSYIAKENIAKMSRD